jgi:hypothetical protein
MITARGIARRSTLSVFPYDTVTTAQATVTGIIEVMNDHLYF